MPTTFKQLAELCKSLETIRKKKEKTKILAKFLTNIDPEEISPAVLLIIGKILPEINSQTLDVKHSTIQKILQHKGQTRLVMYQLTI
jgi:hypothetical protein